MRSLYKDSANKSEEAGVLRSFNVDHIVPVNSSYVCGLHVPWNLQIITSVENSRKSNSIDNNLLRVLYIGYQDFELDSELISMSVDFKRLISQS